MTGSDGGVLRVMVVGAGAFGRNHLRVYRELERAGCRLSWRRWSIQMRALAATAAGGFWRAVVCEGGGVSGGGWGWMLRSVCVPTVHHAACAGS